jgi:hypothetical protein
LEVVNETLYITEHLFAMHSPSAQVTGMTALDVSETLSTGEMYGGMSETVEYARRHVTNRWQNVKPDV